MKRQLLEEHMAMSDRHVALGAQHIERQRKLVAELERDGHDTALAKWLLRQLEELQVLHIQTRDRLREELQQPAQR